MPVVKRIDAEITSNLETHLFFRDCLLTEWFHKKIHRAANPVEFAGIRKPLVQFGRFQEISLHLLFTAGAAVCRGQI